MSNDEGIVTEVTYTFETAHHALWAEDLARERAIAAQVVPAPPTATGACGLALRVPEPDAAAVETLCREEGIRYLRWTGDL